MTAHWVWKHKKYRHGHVTASLFMSVEALPVAGDPLAIDMSFEADQAVQNAQWEVCPADVLSKDCMI